MKGLDAPTMIAIIIAVIAGIFIIYFLWSKGLLPFLGGVGYGECRQKLTMACSGQMQWSEIAEKYKLCSIHFKGDERIKLEDCINNYDNPTLCNEFCEMFLGT